MMYEVYHYIYGDICPDSYYGKDAKNITVGIFCDTERRIKSFVDKLNEKNHSYYARKKPEDEYDYDFVDEDYYSYREIKPISVNQYLHLQKKVDCDTSINEKFNNKLLKSLFIESGFSEEEIENLGL